jgi:hypothetical protein
MTLVTAHYVPDLKLHLTSRPKHVHNNRITLKKRRAANLTRRGPFPERNFFPLVYFFNEFTIRAFLSIWG